MDNKIRRNITGFSEDTIRVEYSEKMSKYQSLAENLREALESFLKNANISYLTISYRLKNIDSFVNKIYSKNYSTPFEQCEDICGLRIICYYQSDIKKISNILIKEFNVLESMDKVGLMHADQFGYRSSHFIVKIKKDWLKAPNYRGLEDLKAEIQVRTVLMHAWAEIEHELSYKKDIYVPIQFKRELSRISAKLEESDEQFEELRDKTEKYRNDLKEMAKKQKGVFDKSLALNFDNLQALLDFYLPTRTGNKMSTVDLLEQLIKTKISIKEIIEAYEKIKNFIPEMEKDFYHIKKHQKYDIRNTWSKVGVIRVSLAIANDKFIRKSPPLRNQYWDKWRKKIKTYSSTT